jgi:hypothetical protein
MNALAAVSWSTSAWFSSGVSASQACSLSPQPSPPSSPNGRSSLWLSPAEYPSADMVMSQITLPIRLVIALSSLPATSVAFAVSLLSSISMKPDSQRPDGSLASHRHSASIGQLRSARRRISPQDVGLSPGMWSCESVVDERDVVMGHRA